MTETNREEWLLTFSADTEEKFFNEQFRQQVVYTTAAEDVSHFVWFEDERYAKLGRAVAEDAGARGMKLQRRTVTTSATDWVDVP